MRTSILLTTLIFVNLNLSGQNFDAEIDKIAKLLSEQFNTQKVKMIAVADFTYRGQPNSRIGKFLADELSISLTNTVGKTFTIVNRENVRKALYEQNTTPEKKNDKTLSRAVDIATSTYTTTLEKSANVLDMGINIFNKKNKKALKDVDIIIFGTIEDKGEESLRVILEATKNNNSSTKENIGGYRGNITKTADIDDLLKGEVAPYLVNNQSSNPNDSRKKEQQSESISMIFKHRTLRFELLGCYQDGRQIECKLQALTSNYDDGLTFIGNSKFYSAEGGNQYEVAEIQLADIIGSGKSNTTWSGYNYISKDLLIDIPINASMRFTNIEKKVDAIAKLEIIARSKLTGDFIIEFKNIPVEEY
jgi:hypothetical protein